MNAVAPGGTVNGAAGIGISTPTPGTTNVIEHNTVTNNGMGGIVLHGHAPGQDLNGNIIVDNTISGNGPDPSSGVGPAGIIIFSDAIHGTTPIKDMTISGNIISNEFHGIWQANATGITLENNTITIARVNVPVISSITAPAAGVLTGNSGGAFAF